jgi:hypothetical protein
MTAIWPIVRSWRLFGARRKRGYAIGRVLLAVASIVFLAASAPVICRAQQASFKGIGFLSGHNTSRADGVSADGSVVAGPSGPQVIGGSPGLPSLSLDSGPRHGRSWLSRRFLDQLGIGRKR